MGFQSESSTKEKTAWNHFLAKFNRLDSVLHLPVGRSVTGRYFGVAPQVGVDLGPVRIAATYNAILGAQLELIENIGGVDRTTHHSQNFLSIELSYQFAGGRKKAPDVSPAQTL